MMLIITIPTYATTMCALDDTVVVVLDPSIGSSASGTYDNALFTWNISFSYGRVYGIAACLPNSGSQGGANSSIVANGGAQTGKNCWCKATHPVASHWVFYNDYPYASVSACASSCAYSCTQGRSSASFRANMFGSVAN